MKTILEKIIKFFKRKKKEYDSKFSWDWSTKHTNIVDITFLKEKPNDIYIEPKLKVNTSNPIKRVRYIGSLISEAIIERMDEIYDMGCGDLNINNIPLNFIFHYEEDCVNPFTYYSGVAVAIKSIYEYLVSTSRFSPTLYIHLISVSCINDEETDEIVKHRLKLFKKEFRKNFNIDDNLYD